MPHGGGHERSENGEEESTVRSRLWSEGEWDIPTVRTAPWWAQEERPMCREDAAGKLPPWWIWEDARPSSEGAEPCDRPTSRLGDDDPTPSLRVSQRRRRADVFSNAADPNEDWWVKNADSLVGPVTTTLLLAGISAGRVPLSCEVLSVRERVWRPITSTEPFAEAFGRLVGPQGRRPR